MNKDAKLVKNCIETPDGTILYSRNKSDYQSHLDENGKTYFTDGGLDYVRCSAHGDEIHHCVWDDEPFDKVRQAVEWAFYDPDRTDPFQYVRLCDMETKDIEVALRSCNFLAKRFHRVMRLELEYRQIKEEMS